MGTLGKEVEERIILYANDHLPLQTMHFNSLQRLRIIIAEQLFQAYASGRISITTRPTKAAQNVAARVYQQLLNATEPWLIKIREDCNITHSSKRTYAEITKDVEVYDIFQSKWGVDTRNHDKAICKEAAYSMIEMGLKSGDPRAIASGYDRLSKINNDFQEAADDFANTAQTEIDLIADVTLVRADAENLSRKAIEDMKRKYGANVGKIEELVMTSDGVYESIPTPVSDASPSDDPDSDFFVQEEQKEFSRHK